MKERTDSQDKTPLLQNIADETSEIISSDSIGVVEQNPILQPTNAVKDRKIETIPPIAAAILDLNETTDSRNSGSSCSQNRSLQRENDRDVSGDTGRRDEFFDSYISSQKSRNRLGSDCSDSVSRCGDGDNKNRKNARIDPYLPTASNPMPESWFKQLQSDSSSLATLVTEKKISDSRRTFCLFVTFDLIMTTLLWLILCGTSATGDYPFFTIVGKQITDYSVNTSMFDVVVLAFIRFAFLVIMYAGLRVRHWWPVAISTSATDILLILKVFPIFENSDSETYLSKAIPMTIVVLLTSFVLSWIEVWFIDFKVLPAEAKLAHKTVRQFIQQSSQNPAYGPNEVAVSERTPLIGNRHATRGFASAHSYYTGATSDQASYYSMPDSDFESVRTAPHRNIFAPHLTHEEQLHIEKGKGALNQLWSLFKNDGIWNLDKELENGDRLFTAQVPGYGKTFRIDTVVHGATAHKIFQEIILNAENLPTWNATVSDVKILCRIGEQTAISLEVSKPAARGLIQSRDFVTVRRVDKFENTYISAGVSTDFPIPESGRVRGINGPTGFIVEPLDDCSCKFTWILNTDLKGSLPQYLVHSNLASTLINFVKAMKQYLGAE